MLKFVLLLCLLLSPVSRAQAPLPPAERLIEQISFRDISLADALAILSEQSDIKIIASDKAADIHVTMFLTRVSAADVIDALARTYRLWYEKDVRSGIIRLHTDAERRPGQILPAAADSEAEEASVSRRTAPDSPYTLDKMEYPEDKPVEMYESLVPLEDSRYAVPIAQVEFKDIAVGDALRILAEQSGLNVVASEEAAQIKVTLFLRNVTVMEVIDAMSKTYNLWYQQDRKTGIVRLYTVSEYRLEKVDFKKEKTEIFTMKNAKNALDFAESIQNLFGFRRVNLSFGNNPQALQADLSNRFSLFDMINSRTSLVNSGRGGSGGGGRRGGFGRGRLGGRNGRFNNNRRFNNGRFGNNLNNADVDEYLNTTDKVLQRFSGDKQRKDNLSSLLLGDQAETRALMSATIRHQAPIFVGVIGRQNRVLVRTRDSDAMAEIRRLYQKLDVESAMLMMEVKILSIDLSDGYNSLFDFKLKSGDFNVSTGGQTSTAAQVLGAAATAAASTFDPTLLATVVSKNFEARLELYEKEGRVTELATPLLLTSNQEVSKVFVGEERPITTGFNSSQSSATNTGNGNVNTPILVPQTDLRSIGTTLLLTPNINADRTVSIRILVEQSTVGDVKATIPVPLNNQLVDAEIDVVQERTFSGTVVASDMQAIAVGGLIEEASASREKKVPVLGDIPLLGFFFRETSEVRGRKELVVIIKPYIMYTPEEGEPISRHVLQDNSVHPNALDSRDPVMDIYRNDRRSPKGYELQPEYKLYDKQDRFDRYHGKGSLPPQTSPAQADAVAQEAQQTYVELTRYAARSVRLPADERIEQAGIEEVFIQHREPVYLLADGRIRLLPVAGWRKGGVNVTAFEVRNTAPAMLRIDFGNVRGPWLASTIESEQLAPQGEFGDSTWLYLISAQPFDELAGQFVVEAAP